MNNKPNFEAFESNILSLEAQKTLTGGDGYETCRTVATERVTGVSGVSTSGGAMFASAVTTEPDQEEHGDWVSTC